MKYTDIIIRILEEVDEPLTVREIWEIGYDMGFEEFRRSTSKNPWRYIQDCIRENMNYCKVPIFIKVSVKPNKYTITNKRNDLEYKLEIFKMNSLVRKKNMIDAKHSLIHEYDDEIAFQELIENVGYLIVSAYELFLSQDYFGCTQKMIEIEVGMENSYKYQEVDVMRQPDIEWLREDCNYLVKSLNYNISEYKGFVKLRNKLSPNKNDYVYGKIISFDESDEKEYLLNMSVVTEYMTRYDDIFYKNTELIDKIIELKDNQLREYLSDIFRDLIGDDDIAMNNLEEMNRAILLEGIQYLSKPYFYEFTATIGTSTEWFELLINRTDGCFYKYKFSNNDEYGFVGETLFSASPFIKDRKILIADKGDSAYNQLSNEYKSYFDTELNVTDDSKIIEKAFVDNISDKILTLDYRINHVGQGLNSTIIINDNLKIAYDIGFSKYYEKESKRKKESGSLDRTISFGEHLYKNEKPCMVILSHWDMDHILGVTECLEAIYDVVWIAPDLNYNRDLFSLSALRLCYYISIKERVQYKLTGVNKQKLHLVSGDLNGHVVSNYANAYAQINLYKGNPDLSSITTENNNIGLVLELCLNDKLLSPGDCDYTAMNGLFKNNTYEYLIAPHHGAYSGKQDFYMSKKYKKSTVVVPVGLNTYGHPVFKDNLRNFKGSKILQTQHIGDLKIKL